MSSFIVVSMHSVIRGFTFTSANSDEAMMPIAGKGCCLWPLFYLLGELIVSYQSWTFFFLNGYIYEFVCPASDVVP